MNINNVINIESEICFREAEDCFLYLNQPKKAVRKLNKAVKLTPSHYKSIILKADIRYMQGKIDEALDLYKSAYYFRPENSKILASIAMCLEAKEQHKEALKYCDRAFSNINGDNCSIYLSLYELKISILLKLKKYEQAKLFISSAKKRLSIDELFSLKNHSEMINFKLRLKNKIKNINLKAL